MDNDQQMTLEEAQRIIRDPSASPAGRMVAASVLFESPESTLDDLLVCVRDRHRSVAAIGAFALHRRTGRPERRDQHGCLVIDTQDWERYLASHT